MDFAKLSFTAIWWLVLCLASLSVDALAGPMTRQQSGASIQSSAPKEEAVMDSHVIARFRELVKAGVIEKELHKQPSMNMELPVINGGVFWKNVAACQDWVIQQHVGPIHGPYDHFRILGPGDVRHAWGTKAYISRRIMDIPINTLTQAFEALGGRPTGATEDRLVFAEFDRLVDSARLEDRLKDQASTNIEGDTAGGKVFWDDLHEHKGWRIQQHRWFGNCRILDRGDRRHAWGSKNYVFRRIMGQPINLLVNYLHNPRNGENSFARYPTFLESPKGSVVLVHGWGCRAAAMEPLAVGLTRFGYDAYSYDYQSSQYSIPQLGERLLDDLKYLAAQLPADEPLHVLTHSMGGLMLRKALELDADGGMGRRISQIVMLGPPNRGSVMADLAVAVGVGQVNESINDMRYWGNSAVKNIGKPVGFTKPFGIIAGEWDFKVIPQDSVHIPDMTEGRDYRLLKVTASHPGLRTSFEALSQAVAYFETGDFARH